MSTPPYKGHRVLAMFPFFNEEQRILQMAPRLVDRLVDRFIGINDGSTDRGPEILRSHGITVLDQPRQGVGACIKRAIRYAVDEHYDILVVMAGNNKDNPAEIPRLLQPIVENRWDYVQGSRFLPGGSSPNLPLFRLVSIRLLSLIFNLYMGQRGTDLTNGFRAYRVSLLDDPRINPWQDWLDGYEMEYYIHWKVHECGYRVGEVPVTKTYPSAKNVPYTKIPPITGWWHMLRPFVLLSLGLKK
jgi:dolichol-phosphate mannosyltransferase